MKTFDVDSSIAPKLREWFAAGRGVIVWSNLEIGVDRPDTFTPARDIEGNPTEKPHWAYGNPQELQPAQLRIVSYQTVKEWSGSLKRQYFGMWLSDASEKKAEKELQTVRQSQPTAERFWEYADNGKARVYIAIPTYSPFVGDYE